MSDSDGNRGASLYKRKGWKGFVHSYKEYTENGNYEKVDWGQGTKEPKMVRKEGNKTIYKF